MRPRPRSYDGSPMVSWSGVILATLGAGSAAYEGRDRLVEAKDVFGKPYKTWVSPMGLPPVQVTTRLPPLER